eukprot:scaffold36288_cov110-Isochrysis_galbana.AAC.7
MGCATRLLAQRAPQTAAIFVGAFADSRWLHALTPARAWTPATLSICHLCLWAVWCMCCFLSATPHRCGLKTIAAHSSQSQAQSVLSEFPARRCTPQPPHPNMAKEPMARRPPGGSRTTYSRLPFLVECYAVCILSIS